MTVLYIVFSCIVPVCKVFYWKFRIFFENFQNIFLEFRNVLYFCFLIGFFFPLLCMFLSNLKSSFQVIILCCIIFQLSFVQLSVHGFMGMHPCLHVYLSVCPAYMCVTCMHAHYHWWVCTSYMLCLYVHMCLVKWNECGCVHACILA